MTIKSPENILDISLNNMNQVYNSKQLQGKYLYKSLMSNKKKICIDYDKYIKSNDWKDKKRHCIRLFGNLCFTECNRKAFYLHHRHYKNLGTEPPHQLVLLCSSCHRLVHGLPDNFTTNQKEMKNNLRRLLRENRSPN